MITYSILDINESEEELGGLLFDHWEETVIRKDVSPFNPNWEWMKGAISSRNMVIVGVRDGGELLGHTIMLISPHPHYGYLMATSHITYVIPDRRGDALGKGMYAFFEHYFKTNMGGDVITIHFKTHVPNPPSLEKYGYEHIENVYIKYLGDE